MAMDRSALLPAKVACFRIWKPVLGNEPESKQASDSNNALRSIAAVNNRSYENLSDKRVNKVVGLFELPTEIPLKLRKHNTAVIYTLDNIKN